MAVTIKGADQLERAFRRLADPNMLRTINRRALGEGAKVAVRAFRDSAPVRTGALRRSMGVIRMKNDNIRAGVRNVYVDKKTGKKPRDYAYVVEHNTPFFYKAWESIKQRVDITIIRRLKNEVHIS